VISSAGCPCRPDHLHFTPAGYRTFGTRYGMEMLSLLGYKIVALHSQQEGAVARQMVVGNFQHRRLQ